MAGSTHHDGFTPDNLIEGNPAVATDHVTIKSGENLVRGAVLGVVTSTGKYVESKSAATNGSEVPSVILAEDVNATADTLAVVYTHGGFNQRAITLGTGHTLATVKPALRDVGILLKASVPA